MARNIDYKVYRPFRQGDKGTFRGKEETWKPKLRTKRWMINPSSGEIITRREWDTARLGKRYEKHVAEKQKQGYVKKQYATKKKRAPPQKRAPPKKKIVKPKKRIVRVVRQQPVQKGKIKRKRSIYQQRADILMDAFLEKISQEYGRSMGWSDLLPQEQSLFWEKYHRLVYRDGPPDEDEWIEEFEDFFDLDYDDVLDLAYGDTP